METSPLRKRMPVTALTDPKIVWPAIGSAFSKLEPRRVYVRQLRNKIEPNPAQPQYILTETGIGYRLKAPD